MHKWVSIGLAVLCAVLLLVLFQLRAANGRLREENRTLAAAIKEQRQQHDRVKSGNAELRKEVESLKETLTKKQTGDLAKAPATSVAVKTGETPAAGAPQGTADTKATDDKGAGFPGRFAKMMEKPEMQEAMRAQQKMMLDMFYGPLFKSLQLTPEQQGQLRDLLVTNQMAGMTLMGPGDKKEKLAAIQKTREQTDRSIKELLGEDQYKVYQDYQETIGERMAVNQFNQQLTTKSMPTDEVQQETLVTVMLEEREKLRMPTPREQQEAWVNGTPSAEAMDRYFQQQEELNARVAERSREFLTEAQQAELKTFQDNQIKMQKLGMQMMRNFMGEEKKE